MNCDSKPVTPITANTPGTAVGRSLFRLSAAVFICGITFGALLPVVSIFVGRLLGFSDVVAGTAVSAHFLATLLTRGYAGRQADHLGARRSMLRGLLSCSAAGVVFAGATLLTGAPVFQLACVMVSRVFSGLGESQLITGALTWGIGLAGAQRSGKVMAWNGMALYGAIAVGAPCGMALVHVGGFALVGIATIGLPLIACLAVLGLSAVAASGGHRSGFREVLGVVWRPGVTLALQGFGFAAISSFVSLYFVARGWANAGLALSSFGFAFVLVRLLLGWLPDRLGGYRVALGSMCVEAVGQLIMCLASNAAIAVLGAAVTGAGCSLMFPALGSMTVKRMPSHSRAIAIGTFTAFQDIAYFVTGPLAGLIASGLGYEAIFGAGVVTSCAGVAMTVWSKRATSLLISMRESSDSTVEGNCRDAQLLGVKKTSM
ncbi:MFS family permease [Caballeronia udeis]|uniref:Uncharacterized MFS-type transporter ABH943_000627 n=1 Tax=Caballeronia udeis TaxID=1232866 RepID=A0ABW8MDT7_9BURK